MNKKESASGITALSALIGKYFDSSGCSVAPTEESFVKEMLLLVRFSSAEWGENEQEGEICDEIWLEDSGLLERRLDGVSVEIVKLGKKEIEK
jgi:hypothetical protein